MKKKIKKNLSKVLNTWKYYGKLTIILNAQFSTFSTNVLIWSIGLNNIYPVYYVYLQEAFFTVNNFYPSK